MVEFDFPNTQCTYVLYREPWPSTPIAQHLVPDGRHSNRHPRKSSLCLSLSLLSSPFSPRSLYLLVSPFYNFFGESVEIGSWGWKRRKKKTKCDELRKKLKEKYSSGAKKKRVETKKRGQNTKNKRERERERGEQKREWETEWEICHTNISFDLGTTELEVLSPRFFFFPLTSSLRSSARALFSLPVVHTQAHLATILLVRSSTLGKTLSSLSEH